MRVIEVCKRTVVTCDRRTDVVALARLMRQNHVGDVIVVDSSSGVARPVGIVTDRDLVVKVLAQGVDLDVLCAEDLFSGNLEVIYGSESMYDAVWHMQSRSVRRLPVLDETGGLAGVLALDDVARFLADELSALTRVTIAQAGHEGERFLG